MQDPGMDPKVIVREGYNRISYEYRDDAGMGPAANDSGRRVPSTNYQAWLAELTPFLHDRDPVLDLGCGCGVPGTAILAERYDVTGVDLSPVQIERARRSVPKARFICLDATDLEFESARFAAIVCFFTLIHIPVAEQRFVIRKMAGWLRPGGYLMATVGTRSWTGTEENWHGAPMYWSHADRDTYLRWLHESGFEVLWERFIAEGAGGHTLVLARR